MRRAPHRRDAGARACLRGEAEGAAIDPIGIYDLTMSSETMVSEGTMEIYGEPGGYLGRVSVEA